MMSPHSPKATDVVLSSSSAKAHTARMGQVHQRNRNFPLQRLRAGILHRESFLLQRDDLLSVHAVGFDTHDRQAGLLRPAGGEMPAPVCRMPVPSAAHKSAVVVLEY